ncbi:unnamed protein product [Heligmosomoides polygyrus]|uniref:DUF4220 domain-containing protein n=1 Tax=Heligmosomoides polygyrus TaxID=6339 RepID=A0A183F211_HELPZ|nr:unnamed protein product [Heligmosomoides polygyrus]
MILELLAIYASIILGCIISTTCLIFLGKGWGPLPHYYLRLIAWMQDFFEKVYPESDEAPWPAIIKKVRHAIFLQEAGVSLYFASDTKQLPVESLVELFGSVQDNVSSIFHPTPSYSETLLRTSPLPHWSTAQKAVFYVSLFFSVAQDSDANSDFRYGILFPTRLCLLLISFVFLACAGVFAVNKKLSDREKTWVGIVYCRLYCCAMGVVATYKNTHLRPKGSGVAVSNHLTPSDVQVLFAGTPHGSQHGFVVTGQKHSGIIGGSI